MKWAHQGILHVRSMEQSKGVYEWECSCACASARSRALKYLQGPEDQKVARDARKTLFSFKSAKGLAFAYKMNSWLGPGSQLLVTWPTTYVHRKQHNTGFLGRWWGKWTAMSSFSPTYFNLWQIVWILVPQTTCSKLPSSHARSDKECCY